MTDAVYFCYSDGNKMHTFKNGGSNRHGPKKVTCKQTLKLWYIFTKSAIRKALKAWSQRSACILSLWLLTKSISA